MEASTEPESSDAVSVGRLLVAGVIGAAVALGCFLPPLLHFLSGPLGPLIGGFVAARWARPHAGGRMIIAATIGVCLAGLVAGCAAAIVRFSGAPSWFPSTDALGLIVAGVAAYGAVLGAIGVALGSKAPQRAS